MQICLKSLLKVVSGRKKLKTVAKDVGTKTVRKQLGGGKKKSKRRIGSISRKVDRKPVALAKRFLTI